MNNNHFNTVCVFVAIVVSTGMMGIKYPGLPRS
jgi:hypothetical protein